MLEKIINSLIAVGLIYMYIVLFAYVIGVDLL